MSTFTILFNVIVDVLLCILLLLPEYGDVHDLDLTIMLD
jgi:hypothetical protein